MRNLYLMAAGCLAACSTHPDTVVERDLSHLEDTLSGVWQSEGYGYILDIDDERSVYNVTADYCVKLQSDQETPLIYFDRFQRTGDDRLKLFHTYEPYPITFNRLATLPDHCQTEASAEPLALFDMFDSFFTTHYAFFDVHKVDWAGETDAARAKLSANSSEMNVIQQMIGLVSQLKDGHVSLAATIDGEAGEFIAYAGPTTEAIQQVETEGRSPNAIFGEQYLRADIEQGILGGHGFDALNERIKYGITDGDIGYLAIMAEGGYTADPDASFEAERAALHAAMPHVIDSFHAAHVKAVIIDLSVNYGGYDFLGRELAGYFTDQPVKAYSKFAADATDRTPFQYKVQPASGPRYTGPVYVMTSDITVSAGETLTLSLRALPNVTHVGMPTRGALSDVLTKYLPNGWQMTLSNEVYTDETGEIWEGRGIEPDIRIPVFDTDNPMAGHLPAIRQLISLIRETQS